MGKPNYVALNLDHEYKTHLVSICEQIKNLIQNSTNNDFIPMQINSLHMTICFLGSVLEKDRKTKEIFIDDQINKFSEIFDNTVLEFSGYELFPPTKKNLIVATFKCSKNNVKFVEQIIQFKNEFVKIGANEEKYFTSHITLGKIQNMQIKNAYIFENMLQTFSNDGTKIPGSIKICGCHLV